MDNLDKSEKFKRKIRQTAAITAILLILSLYIITLILAIANNSYTEKFFYASLFSTVFIPVMLYLISWMAKVFKSYNPNNKEHISTTQTDSDSDK